MLINENDILHYGILRRSGRYPWGSGGYNEFQRNKIFLDYVADLKKKGMTDAQIARGFGVTRNQLEAEKSMAKKQNKAADIAMAERLQAKGMSKSAIGRQMRMPESTVRTLLAPGAKDKTDNLDTVIKTVKQRVDEVRYLDVGVGVPNQIGVTSTMLDKAVFALREQGYELHSYKLPQVFGGQKTNMKVLGTPGTTQKEIFMNPQLIQNMRNFSDDHGRTWYGIHPPLKMDPKRVGIVYAEDGGGKSDGMIYVRPGVEDVYLGGKNYAQVRIAVGDDHYLKGMAAYKTDLPEGVDIQFHTSKKQADSPNKLDVMKKNEEDPENQFGSLIHRQVGVDENTPPDARPTSVMNLVNEEGRWEEWSRSLSSQMLSKQDPSLAKNQLDMTFETRESELKELKALTNPTVRKKLLGEFAEETASASVHLKAAGMPRQGVFVLLPLSKIKPTEIYAPRFLDGERVVLIRHPHGGTFEIPELTVNNKNAEGRRLLGKDPSDAIGIHHDVASQLSGADFDGDTVIVIPNNQNRIKSSHAIEELTKFDPRSSYPYYDGMKVMKDTQKQMGEISNLITDMSIRGAPQAEIVRAIKHSMVVIDAEKHKLNYKLSANDNGIRQLKEKYQPKEPVNPVTGKGGASTLISRARGRVYVLQRKDRPYKQGGPINKTTGEREFVPTGATNYRTGEPLKTRTTQLDVAKDARKLMSSPTGTPMERLYANHSNKLRKMANETRLLAENTKGSKYSPSAAKTYAPQVKRLDAALAVAKAAAPLERQAQAIAGVTVKAARQYNPSMDEDTRNKIKRQALNEARTRTGSKKAQIEVSDDEWEAIQAGAISNSKLEEILRHAKMDVIRKHATPHTQVLMTPTRMARAQDMFNQGATRAQVAAQLGVSLSTLDQAVKVGE